jgi:hypothetical protein
LFLTGYENDNLDRDIYVLLSLFESENVSTGNVSPSTVYTQTLHRNAYKQRGDLGRVFLNDNALYSYSSLFPDNMGIRIAPVNFYDTFEFDFVSCFYQMSVEFMISIFDQQLF